MEITELLEIISRGEDSKHQFKGDVNNIISLAQEMTAFSNSGGGKIFIGISDAGEIAGLSFADMNRLNGLVSNAASQHVRPPINPQTENIALPNGLVMVVTVLDGISKPYMDNQGAILVKSGADKRKVTAREEMQRMFQSAGLIHGDEIPANGITVADVDLSYFKDFFEREYGEKLDDQDIPLPSILENMNLLKDGILNISGALLFAKNPQVRLPIFIVKAVCYPDNIINELEYLDSQDIAGKLADIFQKSLGFLMNNLKRVQGDRNVNAPGEPEIPKETLEELLANALIHRDYFISAPIRVFVFRNRVEIISPGHLPNNLTIENIKSGNSNIRNPILASYATKMLPYRGLGTGIRRALQKYPEIDFENDFDGNQFKVIIKRKA
ncbi:MAG: putative DNA binding domain-containing protein [Candidatus Omnitrophica bacterium]|nr:putative DNA binding domain-containing protein [Candidatus Omnitrophota bacterium]MBU4479134.1 putative DNA binding domain-containing protein [Candidatus Omnitrophota bacterium]MCG2702773.1 putative DNA binding domain-containing protein [Candidatus Omnitrophota bacterium]